MKIKISKIRRDGGTQMRAERNSETVDEYRDKMLAGEVFPPIVVFFDGSEYWLADGFQRAEAAEDAEQTEIECDVREGGKRDAILFACGANAVHGMRRTNADKRKAATTLITDDVWGKWSNREIARRCGVDHTFVGSVRSSLSGDEHQIDRTVRRGESIYQQDVSNRTRTEKTVINGDTGELIENAIVETVTIKPFNKPRIDEDEMPSNASDSTDRSGATTESSAKNDIQGKGIFIANEAINCLTRIPKNDALRKRGFQLVTDWIKKNK